MSKHSNVTTRIDRHTQRDTHTDSMMHLFKNINHFVEKYLIKSRYLTSRNLGCCHSKATSTLLVIAVSLRLAQRQSVKELPISRNSEKKAFYAHHEIL